MAVDKKISQLTSLAQVNVDAALDVLPIVDTSAVETKKVTVSALVGAGATAGISGAVLTNGTINSTTIGATTPSTGAFTSATVSTGNLTFSSTGQRITGDMSNATQSSRLLFQTSTTNGTTNIGAIPNGTGTTAQLLLANSSDPTNASRARFNVGPSEAQINIDLVGTGTYLPMTFYTGGSERMRLDTSGNFGLGTTSPGSRLDVKGTLRLSGSTSGYVGLSPAAAAGSTTYTLPSADGTTGQFLSTNGTGTLSWASASAGGGAQDYIVQRFGIV